MLRGPQDLKSILNSIAPDQSTTEQVDRYLTVTRGLGAGGFHEREMLECGAEVSGVHDSQTIR